MYTIAFDTTAASCSVALMKDDKLLDSFVEEMDFGQAEVPDSCHSGLVGQTQSGGS